MKQSMRRMLSAALILIFLVSCGGIAWQHMQGQIAEQSYDQAEELVKLPDPDPVPAAQVPQLPEEPETPLLPDDPMLEELAGIDLAALREVNGDVLGWITIPDTEIAYPLMQGEDNEYYLEHTWEKQKSAVGSIYLDYRCGGDLTDFLSIIYGHRMKNGSMFAGLKYYKDQTYWSEHPYIYVTDDSGCRRWDIFAVYEADVTGHTYRIGERSAESRQAYIDASIEQSVVDTGIRPNGDDKIMTLSTCTGNGYDTRWVVQAVLWRPGLTE